MPGFRWPNRSWRIRFILKVKRPKLKNLQVGAEVSRVSRSHHCQWTSGVWLHYPNSGIWCTLKCCRVFLLDSSWHSEAHGSPMGSMWMSQISWDILDVKRCLQEDTGLSAGSPSRNSNSAFSSSTPTHRHQGECVLIHEPDPIQRFFVVLQITSNVPSLLT